MQPPGGRPPWLTKERKDIIEEEMKKRPDWPRDWPEFYQWAKKRLQYPSSEDAWRKLLQTSTLQVHLGKVTEIPLLNDEQMRIRSSAAASVSGSGSPDAKYSPSQFFFMDSLKFRVEKFGTPPPKKVLTFKGQRRLRARTHRRKDRAFAEAYAIVTAWGFSELVFLSELSGGQRETAPTGQIVATFLDWVLPGLKALAAERPELEGRELFIIMDRPRWHCTNLVRDTIEAHGFKIFPHASCSQDMNAIEKVWAWLRSAIKSVRATCLHGYKKAIKTHWNRLMPGAGLWELIYNWWPAHLEAVIEADGKFVP